MSLFGGADSRGVSVRVQRTPRSELVDWLLAGSVVVFVLGSYLVSAIPGLSRIPHAAVLVMGFALVLRSSRSPLRLRLEPVVLVFWAFFAFAAASVLWSQDHGVAFVSLVGLAVDVVGATLVWVALQNGLRPILIAVTAGIAACVQAAIGLNQYFVEGLMRTEGLTGNANSLALQLATTAFLLLLVVPRSRWSHVVALGLLVVATLTTGSRKLVFAWASYAFLLLTSLAGRLRRSTLLIASLLMLLPLAGWLGAAYLPTLFGPLGELEFFQRVDGTFRGRETDVRAGLIEEAMERFRERPIAGYGIDQFALLSRYSTYSHNNFTELLANFGVIGFAIYYLVHALLIARVLPAALRGQTQAIVVLAMLGMVLLMDVARVSYASRLLWLVFAVVAYYFPAGAGRPAGGSR